MNARWRRSVPFATAAMAAVAVGLAACRDEVSHEQLVRGGAPGTVGLPSEGMLAAVPIGDVAGAIPNSLATTIHNPYEGNEAAIREGEALFKNMNCADCHGYTLKGGMGPNLVDTYWRYGGAPADIYKSIAEGRPQGMPAWGKALPPDLIWKIVAYLQTFHGAYPAALANRGRQGDLGGEDTSGARTLRGMQSEDH